MKKKKKKPGQQQMSPKQFIKERARNVPLHECLISLGWEESRQPVVMISRKHSNGNISACFYVVDLLCLGVIFSQFAFNVPKEDYNKYKNAVFGGVGAGFIDPEEIPEGQFESISYALAHNIIYAGLEYAADFDIPPHESFQTTRFFIEEDNENIEFIDIECGKEGKPLFIYENLTNFTNFKPEFIINKLEKHAGPGNYHFLYQVHGGRDDSDYDEKDDDIDEYDDDIDEYDDNYFGDEDFVNDDDDFDLEMADDYPDIDIDFENSEYIKKIKNLEYETDSSAFTEEIMKEDLDELLDFIDSESQMNDDDDVDNEMRDKIYYLAFANAYRLCDKDLLKHYYNKYFDMANLPVSFNDIPEEVLPLAAKEPTIRKEAESLLHDAFDPETKHYEAIERLSEIFPDNSFVAFVHVMRMHLHKENKQIIRKTLDAYLKKHPDSRRLQLYELLFNAINGSAPSGVNDEQLIMSTWFSGRKQLLHYFEYFIYTMFVLMNIIQWDENEKLLALTRYVMQQGNDDEVAQFLIFVLPDLLTDNYTKDLDLDDEID